MLTTLINLAWVGAIVGCALAGWIPGLLGIVALLALEGVLELKAIRKAAAVTEQDLETMRENSKTAIRELRDEIKSERAPESVDTSARLH